MSRPQQRRRHKAGDSSCSRSRGRRRALALIWENKTTRMAADGRPMASASFVALVTRVVELEETSTATGPLREALQALLSRFPLCFGYWKRLAELELAHESETAAVAVYERAVVPLAFSVDMWSLYVGHAARHWLAQPERVRALCERGALLVGSDYGADSFWDAYLTCEAAAAAADPSADASRVGALYVRVLALPLRAADAYWLRFQRFAAGCGSSAEVLSREGEARVRAELAGNGAADTGADGEDDGARKMRVLALVEDRFRRHREMHAEQARGCARRGEGELSRNRGGGIRDW
jgi:pre-mRNA-processing factor 39